MRNFQEVTGILSQVYGIGRVKDSDDFYHGSVNIGDDAYKVFGDSKELLKNLNAYASQEAVVLFTESKEVGKDGTNWRHIGSISINGRDVWPEDRPFTEDELRYEKDPNKLLNGRKKPKGWKYLSYEEKIDFISTRLLAEDRHGVTSHNEIKETGILSVSQYERRRNREVYSEIGSLDTIKPTEGIFSRVHVRDLRGRKLRIKDEG